MPAITNHTVYCLFSIVRLERQTLTTAWPASSSSARLGQIWKRVAAQAQIQHFTLPLVRVASK